MVICKQAAHLLAHEVVGVHEDAQIHTEDWDAAEGVAMQARLLKARLHLHKPQDEISRNILHSPAH